MKLNLPVSQIERDYPDEERLISETNLKGFITAANASFCSVAGFSHEELIGKRHNIVRHPDVPPAVFADLWQTIKAGERWTGVVKNRCKNGDHYWVKAFVSPIVRNGEVIGYRSLRFKPTRQEINDADELYRAIRDEEQPAPDTLQTLHRSSGWRARMSERLTLVQQVRIAAFISMAAMAAMGIAGWVGAGPAWIVGLFGTAALVMVRATGFVAKGLREPLDQWRELASALDRGELGARLEIRGHPELSHIARDLNRSLDGIELLTSEMAQAVSGMARGDLTRRVLISLPGDLQRIQQSVNEAAEQMEATVRDLTLRLADLAEGRFRSRNGSTDGAQGTFQEVKEHAAMATTRLTELLDELIETTQALAEGDLTRSIEIVGVGEMQVFYEQMNSAQLNLQRAFSNIRERSDAVALAGRQIAASTQEIATGAEAQTDAVHNVRQLLSATVNEVAQATEDARLASQRSEQTVNVVQAGKQKMERMMRVVRSIEKNSTEIAGVTALIENVAEQTNLLALNASIEAARAGDSGRGFAVVAQEVLKLATTTAQSTQNIRSLIDEAIAAARQADAEANEVAQGMQDIETGVTATDQLLNRVAGALAEQSRALERADAQTGSLATIAQANADATEELAAFAEELRLTAAAVDGEVRRFKTND